MMWKTLALMIVLGGRSDEGAPPQQDLVVHEWGTFTSVVQSDGHEIDWNSLVLDDLPQFIHQKGMALKSRIKGRVRMETPVLYFYTPAALDVSVSVRFPQGQLTEWYPRAQAKADTLCWSRVRIDPKLDLSPATEIGGDHYYASRGVACAPLAIVEGDELLEPEKFLFYRGVGDFSAPLGARIDPEGIHVQNRTDDLIRTVILFERRGDEIATLVERDLTPGEGERCLDRSRLSFQSRGRLDGLKQVLREEGLREDEAQAMIDTWRHDWFEEGLRVFYTVPAATTDALLPLDIEPKPKEIVRVLIGRVEVIEDSQKEKVRLMLKSHREDPRLFDELVERFGRFSLAVAQDIVERLEPNPKLAKKLTQWRTRTAIR